MLRKEPGKQPTLYSYVIPVDDGAAPNPFYGLCTLAICKPVIRRMAKVGDWVVGTRSVRTGANATGKPTNNKDLSKYVIYAMKVTSVLSMREYDAFCTKKKKDKIPSSKSDDDASRLGDCIYAYSGDNGKPKQRNGVHALSQMKRDLSGEKVLLSDHFYYFGEAAIRLNSQLPSSLQHIIKRGQGHRSMSNSCYVAEFIDWIQSFPTSGRLGDPSVSIDSTGKDVCRSCSGPSRKSHLTC